MTTVAMTTNGPRTRALALLRMNGWDLHDRTETGVTLTKRGVETARSGLTELTHADWVAIGDLVELQPQLTTDELVAALGERTTLSITAGSLPLDLPAPVPADTPIRYEQITLFAEDLPDHTAQLTRYEQAGLTAAAARTLEERAARIISIGRRAVVDIGVELLAARQEAERGTWGAFLARCGVEERTAQNYMLVARRFRERPEIISAIPSSALYALSSMSIPDDVAVQIAEEAVAATQAGVPPTPAELKARVAEARPQPPPQKTAPKRTAYVPEPTPAAADDASDEVAGAPAPRPAVATLPPPLLMPSAPAAAAPGADLQAVKILTAKVQLLAAALEIVSAELRRLPDDAPMVVYPIGRIDEAAKGFVSSPALLGAVGMLSFSAVVEV